jgi:hypothetical protein
VAGQRQDGRNPPVHGSIRGMSPIAFVLPELRSGDVGQKNVPVVVALHNPGTEVVHYGGAVTSSKSQNPVRLRSLPSLRPAPRVLRECIRVTGRCLASLQFDL